MKKIFFISSFLLLSFLLLSGTIDLNSLHNYANQTTPNYITKDNIVGNPITDEGATLGRVLFYDKRLSSNNTISCASCHRQAFAFGDTAQLSQGVNDIAGRHSMRLVNSRYAAETHFFWDERADSLEIQTTMPIRDHGEMGYSGTNGDPTFADLLVKLDGIDYYNDLFQFTFGDTLITEDRIQKALAQFIRSIQSFDAKYDQGRAQVANDGVNFPNFTNQENFGKQIFLAPRNQGGAGCAGCHRPPEFDIDPNSLNNGDAFVAGNPNAVDITNTRAPSIRDIVNPNGQLNGPLMHTGRIASLSGLINHYNSIPNIPGNTNLDPRLTMPSPNGPIPQQLNLNNNERNALIAFLQTLTGLDVYTNPKWSDPFDANGDLTIIPQTVTSWSTPTTIELNFYPNPVQDYLNLEGDISNTHIQLVAANSQIVLQTFCQDNSEQIEMTQLPSGWYLLHIQNEEGQLLKSAKIIKQ